MVLYVLSQIWKSGATIERDTTDGQLALKNHQKVNPTVLKAAEPIFDEINAYIKSVEDMNAIDTTVWKMIVALCGWIKNDAITEFLNNDETALNLFLDYQVELTKNGWVSIFDDWREYENEKTEKIKIEIFKRAVAFAKNVKK